MLGVASPSLLPPRLNYYLLDVTCRRQPRFFRTRSSPEPISGLSEALEDDQPSHAMPMAAAHQQRSRSSSSTLSAINDATKWVVSGTAAVFLVLRHDAPVMWCLLGSIVSSFINKVGGRQAGCRPIPPTRTCEYATMALSPMPAHAHAWGCLGEIMAG